MKIKFSPMRRDAQLELSVSGDTLVLNNRVLDFSTIGEGETRAAEEFEPDWLVGEIRRTSGEIHLMVILPHGANAPVQTLFPQDIVAGEGPIILPPYD